MYHIQYEVYSVQSQIVIIIIWFYAFCSNARYQIEARSSHELHNKQLHLLSSSIHCYFLFNILRQFIIHRTSLFSDESTAIWTIMMLNVENDVFYPSASYVCNAHVNTFDAQRRMKTDISLFILFIIPIWNVDDSLLCSIFISFDIFVLYED